MIQFALLCSLARSYFLVYFPQNIPRASRRAHAAFSWDFAWKVRCVAGICVSQWHRAQHLINRDAVYFPPVWLKIMFKICFNLAWGLSASLQSAQTVQMLMFQSDTGSFVGQSSVCSDGAQGLGLSLLGGAEGKGIGLEGAQLERAVRHKSGAVVLCEKVWPWVFFAKLLLEDPWVEAVKMGYFEDSVPGLTLSFIILRVLRWFQHWFSCLSFSMLDFHYCSDNTSYKYLWLLISWWKYEDCVTCCSVPSEDSQYQLRVGSNNSQMNTWERSTNCK